MTDRLSTFLEEKGLQLRKMDDAHYVNFFSCGQDLMDEWFCETALKWQREDMCAVWVLSASDDDANVLGFFTLSAHQIIPSNVHKTAKAADAANRPWINNLDHAFPAQLLGKFAIEESQQGTGLASVLMYCVYAKHVAAADSAAAKFLVVDVQEHQLVSYYTKRFGFIQSELVVGHAQMYRPTSVIRQEVEELLASGTEGHSKLTVDAK